MKALTIIRVSSRDQKFAYGEDSQWEDDVLQNAPGLGLEVCADLRRNIEESATGWDRLKFGEIVEEALQLHSRGVIEAVVFPRIDRETRFIFSSMPFLSAMLKAGLRIYFARELLHLDPKDPEAVGTYLNKVGQSQAYAETMRVNTLRGRRRRVTRDGLLPTGGVNLYGYFYDKNTGKRQVNSFEADVIRKMVDYVLLDRLSLNEVCRRLMADSIPAPKGGKQWSRATVGRILNNETYTGKTYALKMDAVESKTHRRPGAYRKSGRKLKPREEWVLLPADTTPQIVTDAEFAAIQKQLARNRELSPRNQKFQYLLRGFVSCRECGRKYYGMPTHGKRYYRCSGRSSVINFGQQCNTSAVNADQLEAKVWGWVLRNMFDPEECVKVNHSQAGQDLDLKQLKRELEESQQKLAMLDNAETRLLRVFEFTDMPEAKLKAEHQRIKDERAREEQKVSSVEREIGHYEEITLTDEEIRAFAVSLGQIIEEASCMEGTEVYDHKRSILEMLGLKVDIGKESFTICIGIPSEPARQYNAVLQHS